ncbi:uncharacterized protein LOC106171491 [Lingula anatina]|uniref:Uncharacterized protein LOC106171491 n=1 Tax=Lingula anatina TaxID=7574 RepID=A0A1S3JA89_LINAN|nr:uncharacterized protein LOC106171491 [Lingula anatina]|eukprot:XP_013407317.1 uncharacterized protein LOC106171491 [Lingula anatina]
MPELMLTTERVRSSTDYLAIETTPESSMLTWSTGKTRQHTGNPTVETTPESPVLTWSTGKKGQRTGNPTVETTTETGTNDSGGGAAREMNPEGSEQGLTIILPAVTGVILLCGIVIATALWVLKRKKRSKIQTSPVGEDNGDPSSTQKDINDSREDPQEESSSEIPYVPPTTGAIPPTLKHFSTNPSHSGSDRLQSKDTDSSHEDKFGKTGEQSVSDDVLHVSATGGATVPHDLPPVSSPFDQTDQNIQRRLPARLPPLTKE